MKHLFLILLLFLSGTNCARYRFNRAKLPENGNCFVASGIFIPDTLFPEYKSDNCSKFNSDENPANMNILLKAGAGSEKYLILFHNFILPADENIPCCYQDYTAIKLENGKPDPSKSIISLTTCEIPHYVWIPNDIRITKDSIIISAMEFDIAYEGKCQRMDTTFRFQYIIDSAFSFADYSDNVKRCEELTHRNTDRGDKR